MKFSFLNNILQSRQIKKQKKVIIYISELVFLLCYLSLLKLLKCCKILFQSLQKSYSQENKIKMEVSFMGTIIILLYQFTSFDIFHLHPRDVLQSVFFYPIIYIQALLHLATYCYSCHKSFVPFQSVSSLSGLSYRKNLCVKAALFC